MFKLKGILLMVDQVLNVVPYRIDSLVSLDGSDAFLLFIVMNYGYCLRVVGSETLLECFGCVV